MKGLFKPRNVEKYVGDPTKIRIMSSWELRVFQWLDQNPAVIRWSSEPMSIPYLSPIDKKIHRYYPDIYAEIKQADGTIARHLIEIKPEKEAVLKPRAKPYDKLAVMVNHAKWNSARQVCERNGIKFSVLTERQLFKK